MSIEATKKMLLIVNPVAGRMSIRHNLVGVLQVFTEAGYLTTTFTTQGRGDARDFVMKHGQEYDAVSICGGDGSLNELISGIIEADLDIPVGYIPAGSTNVFGDYHNLPHDAESAARNIVRGKEVLIDLATFNDQYFSYVAATGAFAGLSYSTNQDIKNLLGHKAYYLEVAKELAHIKPQYLRFESDGKLLSNGEYIFVSLSSCDQMAGTFKIPKGTYKYDDGLFELILVRYPKDPLRLEEILRSFLTYNYDKAPEIEYYHITNLRIETPSQTPWTLDGEESKAAPEIDIRILQKRLRLMSAARLQDSEADE